MIPADAPARILTFRWRTSEDDERDAESAERERLRDEGKHVVSIGRGDPDGGKTIEHEAGPEPSGYEVVDTRPQSEELLTGLGRAGAGRELQGRVTLRLAGEAGGGR
jgi:hypothetical protein